MPGKPSDLSTDGNGDSKVVSSAADSTANRLLQIVQDRRGEDKVNVRHQDDVNMPNESDLSITAQRKNSPPNGVALNYYEGKLTAGAGINAANGLKSMFEQDRANGSGALNALGNRIDGLKKVERNHSVVDGLGPIPDLTTELPRKKI